MHTMGFSLSIVALAGLLSACSAHSPDAAVIAPSGVAMSPSSAPSRAKSSTAPPVSAENACALLSDDDIRSFFPKAASGKRNTGSLEYGFDRCAWETPTGQIGVEVVTKVEADAFENELRGELTGVVDPTIEGAADQIVFQPIVGIGDHAIAILEKAEKQRGLLSDVALIAIQRGHRMAVLMVHEASSDAPLPTLDSLESLGRKLAARL